MSRVNLKTIIIAARITYYPAVIIQVSRSFIYDAILYFVCKRQYITMCRFTGKVYNISNGDDENAWLWWQLPWFKYKEIYSHTK